jgi:hypothetical protein
VHARSVAEGSTWWDDFESRVAVGLNEHRSQWAKRAQRKERELAAFGAWHPPLVWTWGEERERELAAGRWHPPLAWSTYYQLKAAARYSSARADALSQTRMARASTCGARHMTLRCRCGPMETATDCGQPWLCDRCRRRYYGRTRRRTVAAVSAHVAEAAATWAAGPRIPGTEPRLVMVTLSVRHSGQAGRDRERIVRGWKRLRTWIHSRIGRFPFVMLWEVTDGALARLSVGPDEEDWHPPMAATEAASGPHVHCHILALWPYFDWAPMAAHWKECIGDPGARAPFVTTGVHGPDGKRVRGPDGKPVRLDAKVVAKYAAKYATKGVQLGVTSPETAAEVVSAWYGKRRITVSLGFWRKREPCCERCKATWRVVARPAPPTLAPAELLAALRERNAALTWARGFSTGAKHEQGDLDYASVTRGW